MIIQQRSGIDKSTKGLFLWFSHKPTGSCIGNHYDAIVDIETIPFHPLVATAETTTSILSGTKSEPSHLHPKSKQHLPNLPPLPEPELEPEQQQEFQIKLEPTEPEPEFVPEEAFGTKVEPTEPEPEFVPEEAFETKLEPTVPKAVFTIPNTEDSTTLEYSTHRLPLILHCPEKEFIPPPAIHRRKWAKSTINMSAFSNVTPEVVDRMPWIPDGDHIYIIRCEEDYWHDKQIDGCPWQMTKVPAPVLLVLKSLELAEDLSSASMMIAQYTQPNTLETEWISGKEILAHIHVPTAKYLFNVGSAMHEKLLNLTEKTMY